MLLIPERKLFFIHVPKAGGTSFKEALRASPNKSIEYLGISNRFDTAHLTLDQINRWLPKLWEALTNKDSLSIAFVRHPLARAISAHGWFLRSYGFPMDIEAYLTTASSLADWDHRFVHAVPQHRFVYYKNRKVIQHVFKLELLGQQIDKIRALLKAQGISLETIPRKNVAPHPQGKIDLNRLRPLVQKLYAKDFELWGYS